MSFFNRNSGNAPRAPPPSSLGPGGTYTSLPSQASLPPRSGQASPAPAREPPTRRPAPADPFQSGRVQPPPQPQSQGYAGGGQGYGAAPPALPSREREKYGQLAGAAGYGAEKEYGYDQRGQQGQGQGYGQTQSPRRAGGGHWPRLFNVAPCPNDSLALTSKLVVCPNDDFGGEYVRIKGGFVMATIPDPTGTVPPGHIAPSKNIRQWASISQHGEQVEVEPFAPANGDWAMSVDAEVGFMLKREESRQEYESEKLSELFISAFNGIPVQPNQPIVFDYHGVLMRATIRAVNTLEGMDGAPLGLLMDGTEIRWSKDPGTSMKLKNTSKRAPTTGIIAPNFKFEDMGIGGLDSEFSAIFRRAFASRIFPPGLVDKLGITHVKGILLFGPPGTGKTLMARQIGKMLNAREPKVVNGPEILNKFVGQSEENIRKLFADAEKEQKEKGDESGLHIIIFDELDAICKQRGSTNSGTGVGDSVVNQLLAKMDGVDQLNNVLIIGMTNRKDMIDEALLRPGRLEVHIEISLPDEAGRVQILNIHTSKMKKNGVMAADVDVMELAALTKNFSGAELNGLVKSATSFAFNRHVKVGTVAGISDDIENIQITRADFMLALDEVHAAFGVSEEELQQVVENGIIPFSPEIDNILRDGSLFVQQVKKSERTPLVSVLVHGPAGSGKTALAATMALASEFPFIKLISPESMVGYSESQKVAQLNKVFTDSYKSPLSVIVVDSIERLLDWNPIGPRFSNSVLQGLAVLLGKRPPKGRRLLIFATTSNRAMLTDMELTDAFDADIRVPPLTSLDAVDHVLHEVDLFQSEEQYRSARRMMEQAGFGTEGRLNLGVKRLLQMAEMARQDADPAEKLVGSMIQQHS